MKVPWLKTVVALGLPLFLAAGVFAAARKPIAVSLSRKEIRGLDGSGLVLAFIARVENSSSTPYVLTRYEYRVVVRATDYFSLKTSLKEPIEVPARGETLITLPVKITYTLLFDALPSARELSELPCYVTGLFVFTEAKKKEQKVPFAFSSEFPVYRDLVVQLLPLELNALTIGGADLVFSFSCRNPNAWDVVLGEMAYRLRLGGKDIADGRILGPIRLAAGTDRVFPLSLILDFFELGSEFHGILDQPSVRFELEARAKGTLAWGDLDIVILEAQDIPVLKK